MNVVNAENGGYDYEPVNETSKDLLCVICFKLMKNPVQFNCGHGMCSSCYKDLIENTENRNSSCPQCRELIFDCQVVKNVMLHRLILALKVKCKNVEIGCQYTCELSEMESHLKGCEYEKMKCPNVPCEHSVERRNLHLHLSECIVKTLVDSKRSVQQLKWATSKQDKEIHMLRSKLRDSLLKQNRLEQEVGRLNEKIERIEHTSRSRNEKNTHNRLYESLLKKIAELSQKQNQTEFDLNMVKAQQIACGVDTSLGCVRVAESSVEQRLSPVHTTPQDLQDIDYELVFSNCNNNQQCKNYSSAGGNVCGSNSDGHVNHAFYGDFLPVLQNMQNIHQQSENKDPAPTNLQNADNLFRDNHTAIGQKKQLQQDRSTFEPLNSLFW